MLIAVATCIASTAGCVAIPCGELTTREVVRSTPVKERKLSGVQISARLLEAKQALEVRVLGDYLVHAYRDEEYDEVVRKKLLIIGFYPGIGSAWWVGKPCFYGMYVEDVGMIVIGNPLFNACFLGLPTIASWFDYGAEWKPCSDDEENKRAASFSLFGWAKSSKEVRRLRRYARERERKYEERIGVAGVTVVCSSLEPSFRVTWLTDVEGKALLYLPPELASHVGDVRVTITATGPGANRKECQLVIPADAVSRMAKAIRIKQLLAEAENLFPNGKEIEPLRQRLKQVLSRLGE